MKQHNNEQRQAWTTMTTGRVTKEHISITKFEQEVARLGLVTSEYADSVELKVWCEANKNTRYIPEWLLKAYEMVTDWDEEKNVKPTTLTTIIPFDEMQELEEADAANAANAA